MSKEKKTAADQAPTGATVAEALATLPTASDPTADAEWPGADEAEKRANADATIKAANLVRMTRNPGQWPAPHEADVHVTEVQNYRAGGWVEA